MCVHVCVSVREREREREGFDNRKKIPTVNRKVLDKRNTNEPTGLLSARTKVKKLLSRRIGKTNFLKSGFQIIERLLLIKEQHWARSSAILYSKHQFPFEQ